MDARLMLKSLHVIFLVLSVMGGTMIGIGVLIDNLDYWFWADIIMGLIFAGSAIVFFLTLKRG